MVPGDEGRQAVNPVLWLESLTDHQLQLIGTVFSVMSSGATVLGVVAANYARLARRDARVARANTAHTEYVNGQQRSISVTEYARHAATEAGKAITAGEASRQETDDLAVWVRGDGKRRAPTTDIPQPAQLHPEESHYE